MQTKNNLSWDEYFYLTCKQISLKSPCLSRRIGAILVRDKSIISTGYNGPARGIPHCGHDRLMKDDKLHEIAKLNFNLKETLFSSTCPRKVLGYKSGSRMELCPAQHAEENCISSAARNGTNTSNSTLYISSPIPCKNCFSTLINAGIKEIVCKELVFYDSYTEFIANNSSIKIRNFSI